ncbi:unnamed protein product [Paramecium sonneborni]|uniref:Uncharacterized protein n=1 Tax=Paramecium sonneborni TaxID=65129 RepID=A0A8S1NCC8_9CILI|nr:unnamed protein product [Paramecium sonneborni]
MQFDQDIGPWRNDENRPSSRYNNSHSTSINKNQSEIKGAHQFTHQINSERRNLLPRLKLSNINPRVFITKISQNESVRKREESLDQQALPQLLKNKELLQFKRYKNRQTEIKVVLEIEKIIRRNLFYVPTHKFTMID